MVVTMVLCYFAFPPQLTELLQKCAPDGNTGRGTERQGGEVRQGEAGLFFLGYLVGTGKRISNAILNKNEIKLSYLFYSLYIGMKYVKTKRKYEKVP